MTFTSIIHTKLSYGLVDGHVVRDDVIVDQKLELVTDVVALRHQHGRLGTQTKPKTK